MFGCCCCGPIPETEIDLSIQENEQDWTDNQRANNALYKEELKANVKLNIKQFRTEGYAVNWYHNRKVMHSILTLDERLEYLTIVSLEPNKPYSAKIAVSTISLNDPMSFNKDDHLVINGLVQTLSGPAVNKLEIMPINLDDTSSLNAAICVVNLLKNTSLP